MTCVQDAKPEESGSPSGAALLGQEPAGCLILRLRQRLDEETASYLRQVAAPMAQRLNLEMLVLDEGAEAEIRYSQDPLLAALKEQIAAINRLAASNEGLSQAVLSMIEEMTRADEQDSDDEPRSYMDGSPVR